MKEIIFGDMVKLTKRWHQLINLQWLFFFFLDVLLYVFGFSVIVIGLEHINEANFTLLNYGFVIFLGLSSICFSWAKSLPQKEEKLFKRIYKCGIKSLQGSIIFLIGAIFKCVMTGIPGTLVSVCPKLVYFPKIGAYICFVVATTEFLKILVEILKIIRISVRFSFDDNQKNDSSI
jgi:hypothetical protein